MSFFINDVKKLYKNKLVLSAFIVLFLCAVIDPVFKNGSFEFYQNPHMWWLFMNTGIGSSIFNTLYWIFPVLLTGLLFFDEKNSAIYGILITKGKRVSYFASKALSVFFVTFISLICIFLFNLFLVYIICPAKIPIEEYLIPRTDSFAYPFFQKSPLIMAVVYNILHAFTLAILSVLYQCLHMVLNIKNKYLAMLIPPILVHVVDFIIQATGNFEFSIIMLLQPMAASASSVALSSTNMICVLSSFVFVTVCCFMIGVGRNRDVL